MLPVRSNGNAIAILCLSLAWPACDGRDVADIDAYVPDAAPDGSPDAFTLPDALIDAAFDAAPDAIPPDASPPDADPCAACVTSSPCHLATCQHGRCVEDRLADGTLCGEGDVEICVRGACSSRGCGDGYREPGPRPVRESCDDGNSLAGDACSPSCEPSLVIVSSRPEGVDTPSGPAHSVGIDDAGRALFVWSAVSGSSRHVWARELTWAEPILLSEEQGDADAALPTVLGLKDGWVVVWTSPAIDQDGSGIALSLVAADGSVSPPQAANLGTLGAQSGARLARAGDGFVLVFSDRGVASGTGVRARLFFADGTPRGPELLVSPSMEYAADPVVAAQADGFLVAWSGWVLGEAALPPSVRARRFDATGFARDAEPILVSDKTASGQAAWSFGVDAAALATGDYALAWTSYEGDTYGDVRARVVPVSGAPQPSVAIAAAAATRERTPSIAPLRGDAYAVLVHRVDRSVYDADLDLYSVGAALDDFTEVREFLGASGAQGHGSLASGPSGLWLTWSDDTLLSPARRSFVAYLLPIE